MPRVLKLPNQVCLILKIIYCANEMVLIYKYSIGFPYASRDSVKVLIKFNSKAEKLHTVPGPFCMIRFREHAQILVTNRINIYRPHQFSNGSEIQH